MKNLDLISLLLLWLIKCTSMVRMMHNLEMFGEHGPFLQGYDLSAQKSIAIRQLYTCALLECNTKISISLLYKLNLLSLSKRNISNYMAEYNCGDSAIS